MAVIHRIRGGSTSNVFLIKGENGYVMVDTGSLATASPVIRFMKANEILPQDIRLIILTHVHYDHANGLKRLREFCGCPAAVHRADTHLLRSGSVVVSPGTTAWGLFFGFILSQLARLARLAPAEEDITLSGEMSLEEYGIDGKIIPTPGHTSGSVSVLLATGETFVGDLAINHLPFHIDEAFPPFATDVRELFNSWQRLLDAGAKIIYPGHGSPYAATKLKERMQKPCGRHT